MPPTPIPESIRFFGLVTEFRRWLTRNGKRERELWVGFYKQAARKAGITYTGAVDQALSSAGSTVYK